MLAVGLIVKCTGCLHKWEGSAACTMGAIIHSHLVAFQQISNYILCSEKLQDYGQEGKKAKTD